MVRKPSVSLIPALSTPFWLRITGMLIRACPAGGQGTMTGFCRGMGLGDGAGAAFDGVVLFAGVFFCA
jgi:hypothetical protein